jgi:DNA-binding NarL/FixJ family response regulator
MTQGTNRSSAPIRVLLGDESETGLLLLAAMLEDDPRFEVVSSVSTGAQLLAHSARADLVVLDLTLADEDAFTVIGLLCDRAPDLPVVVFSAVDPPYLRAEAEAHGATAFFRRGADPQTVLDGFADAAHFTKAD